MALSCRGDFKSGNSEKGNGESGEKDRACATVCEDTGGGEPTATADEVTSGDRIVRR